MTDIDNSTGEVLDHLPVTTSDPWKDRLQDSYRMMAEKTVPAILDFAAEVKAFNDDCTERKQGGSTFSAMAQLWLNMSEGTVFKWLKIGDTSKLLRSAKELPPSWDTIYGLTQLPTRKFTECIKDGRINPLMTRAQAKDLKPETSKTRMQKMKSVEDLYQKRVAGIINTLAAMSEEEKARAFEAITTYIHNTGENNE